MRRIQLTVSSVTTNPDSAYALISNFTSYPELVDEVKKVDVRHHESGLLVSDWEVVFRNGPLRWTEIDYKRPASLTIEFEQIEGDFQTFRGAWQVSTKSPSPGGCSVSFTAEFDFGIESLQGVLEPIAEKVLKEGIGVILSRLLSDAEVVADERTANAVRERIQGSKSGTDALAVSSI